MAQEDRIGKLKRQLDELHEEHARLTALMYGLEGDDKFIRPLARIDRRIEKIQIETERALDKEAATGGRTA